MHLWMRIWFSAEAQRRFFLIRSQDKFDLSRIDNKGINKGHILDTKNEFFYRNLVPTLSIIAVFS